MKLNMADITNHKNNWAGRLQIQLAPISSEFFSLPYKFETTAKNFVFDWINGFIVFILNSSVLTWWKFQMNLNSIIFIIDNFVHSTAQALFDDSHNISINLTPIIGIDNLRILPWNEFYWFGENLSICWFFY